MPYSSNPTTVPRDQVYILLGLTQPDQLLITDGEIDWFISQTGGDTTFAAVKVARNILFKLSQKVRSRFDGMELYSDQAFDQWSKALQMFIEVNDPENPKASLAIALTKANGYAGGISVSDIQANYENLDNNVIVPQREFPNETLSDRTDRTTNPFVI